MKILFACLMCVVLGASECFAIKGGPEYPAGGNIVGTYGGVLQGMFDPTTPSSSNTIGVFSLGVPRTGNATGPFVMFARGRVFSGTIQATADPIKASIKGVLSATYDYTLSEKVTDIEIDANGVRTFTTKIITTPVTASANGPLSATVASSKSASALSTSTTILQGLATLNVSQGQVAANGDPIIVSIISLSVSGFKQSDTAPTGTTITTGGG